MKQIEQPGMRFAKLAHASSSTTAKERKWGRRHNSRDFMFKQNSHAEATGLREDNDV